MKKILSTLALILFVFAANAQILTPIKWKFSSSQNGDEMVLKFTASIDEHWHLYDVTLPEGGPIPTVFNYNNASEYTLVGDLTVSPQPVQLHDPTFDMELRYYEDEVTFTQVVKVKEGTSSIEGYVEFMGCDDKTCLPPTEVDFSFPIDASKLVKKEEAKPTAAVEPKAEKPELEKKNDHSSENVVALNDNDEPADASKEAISESEDVTVSAVSATESNTDENEGNSKGLWVFFFLSFLAGLAAILTPCVFPMIPMTVSFFMHSGESKAKGRILALFYGFSIVFIYTVIGTIVALVFGPGIANFLSTHWIPNLIFFFVFMIFAFSFFGMFEITLPSWLVNKSDKGADKGGFLGAFFMAFTLVLVSFSCTGPIVGAILVQSAGGEVLTPIVGMLGFSLAFALPFTLFAIFPGWLSNLPKSGGWLNSVKVVLGFLELALGLKFLSIADQTYHWGILDREIYLAIWIVIFTLMGLYLLGKLKFPHDSEVKFISVPRLMLSICTFAFVVYMIPGMFGAPLKGLSGYMPPIQTQDFNIREIVRDEIKLSGGVSTSQSSICGEAKYSDFLHLPHGLEGYFDYEQGMACAKEQGKPVFIDFTGHGCVNCREMEANVWSDPRVLERLKNDYVIIALYVDDKTELPAEEWVTSTYDNKVKKTIGKKYADFQISRYNVNAQPYYVLLDNDGNKLVSPKAYDLNPDNFVKFLDEGIANYHKK